MKSNSVVKTTCGDIKKSVELGREPAIVKTKAEMDVKIEPVAVDSLIVVRIRMLFTTEGARGE